MSVVSGVPSINRFLDSSLSGAVGGADGGWGGRRVPVGAGGDNVLAAEVASAEAEVAGGKRRVGRDDVTEVAGDSAVEADLVARGATQVTAEGAEAGVELLKHHSLSLDLADLLGDDPLGHLLDDKETLLDDFDGLAVADDFLLVLNNGLGGEVADEVIGAVEVVETRERGHASPVIERVSTSSETLGEGLSSNTGDESRGNSDLDKLGEHFE